MRAESHRESETSPEDPLEQLRRRIADARAPRPPAAPVQSDPERADDPLEILEQRVESASDPEQLSASSVRAAAPEPLGSLYDAIDRARRSSSISDFYDTESPVSSATGDPLQELRRMIRAEIDELGSRATVELPRTRAETPSPRVAAPDIEARLGRELLEMLAERDLPASARAEAVRRLAANLDDPEPDELRSILRLLIAPDD